VLDLDPFVVKGPYCEPAAGTVKGIRWGGDPKTIRIDFQGRFRIVRAVGLFGLISTGVYHFPLECATGIAIKETLVFLEKNALPEKVIFVCFGAEALGCYRRVTEQKVQTP
jgi:hypothetical protein